MYQRLNDILNGKGENYLLPFYWQHGDHRETIPREVERIYESGARAFCVESRPHRDFVGEGWWADMDIILREAKARGMKVWILDDDHFPTGHAVGKVKEHPHLRKWHIMERHADIPGPVKDGMLYYVPENEETILLGIYAYGRTGEGEVCDPEYIDLSGNKKDGFVHFDLPYGLWRIYFIYKTRRGTDKGDYIDMMNPEAVRLLIDTVYEAHYAHYAEDFGDTIEGFFSDEPCFGNIPDGIPWGVRVYDYGFYDRRVGDVGLALPWSDKLPKMIEERIGEAALPQLAALWCDLGEPTSALRHAYMDCITLLYRDAFTRQIGDWCEEHGVKYIGHIIEDMNAHARTGCGAGHYFRALDGQHMSGIDIVLNQLIPGIPKMAHTTRAAGNYAEPAFFHSVLAKLASSYSHINPQMQGRAMCEVYGAYGWGEGSPIMKWLSDHLLVRGVNHFVPHAFSPKFPDPDCPPHFGGGDKDPQFEGFCHLQPYINKVSHLLSGGTHIADVALLYHAELEWANGRGRSDFTQRAAEFLAENQIDYDIIPADCFLPHKGARLYPARAEDGRLAIGDERYQALIVPFCEIMPAEIEKALSDIEAQGVNIIRMRKDMTDAELYRLITFERDIEITGSREQLRHYHTRNGDTDVFMFVNESTVDRTHASVKFNNIIHMDGVALDLLNGEEYALHGNVKYLGLAPYQSLIIIFDGHKYDLPTSAPWVIASMADLTFRIETASYEDMESFVTLDEGVKSDDLYSVTAMDRTPRFSGKIRYTATFKSEDVPKGKRVALDLGEVGVTSHLYLNGTDCGIRLCPPYRYDLTDVIREGENELTVVVSNTLGNVLQDNSSLYMHLAPSGLLGKIKWMRK
ncbi:MAG: hypothetical protein IJ519_05110 [Clostridia bacterium]|nr:hypothetical protein [Clostridia bacterium]